MYPNIPGIEYHTDLSLHSFPYTEHETVPTWLLVVLCAAVPVVVIFLVTLVLVPGATVPRNTPASLIWQRKLWELHVGWLGLLMAVGSAFFLVSGIKNMCGKPRPDLLARCEPDLANAAKYIVGGFSGEKDAATLYSGDICKQTDSSKLDDGFRSYPSGHSAASAGGLIYLSLFLASKFSVTLPFVLPRPDDLTSSSYEAFPSRSLGGGAVNGNSPGSKGPTEATYNSRLHSLRRQAAAPPVYLLAITLVPFCVAIFIAASRWFNYRHHGFDILFGFLIGIITAIYSFRYYHMPIAAGAGWAWGPRSSDRAFWAGLGRLGYVGGNSSLRRVEDEVAQSGDVDARVAGPARPRRPDERQQFQFQDEDVEMGNMDSHRQYHGAEQVGVAEGGYGRAQ